MNQDLGTKSRSLNSWKDIAAYLGRDVRTVIRWEKERGLPIRRVPDEVSGRPSVRASSDELDRWLLGHSCDQLEPVAAPEPPPPAVPAPSSPAARSNPWRWILLLSAAILIFCLSWLLFRHFVAAPTVHRLDFSRTDFSAQMPWSVAAADFDSDGHLDILFTNLTTDTLSILINNGAGTFIERHEVPSPGSPERLVVADFNGDGFPDIAVTHKGSGDVTVLLGDGHANFHQSFAWNAGGRARWISAADIDHDGNTDLLVACSSAKKLGILMGRGNGTFDRIHLYDTDGEPSSLAVGDFNQDGIPEVLVADYQIAGGNTVSLYTGVGDGTFHARIPFRTGYGPLAVAAADLDSDGRLDLVTADFHDTVSVLRGRAGGFSDPVSSPLGRANGFVVINDFDRDGNLDVLFVGEHSDTAYLRFGDGRGNFPTSQQWPTGAYPDAIAVADFNHDGRLDFVVANVYGNSISLFTSH